MLDDNGCVHASERNAPRSSCTRLIIHSCHKHSTYDGISIVLTGYELRDLPVSNFAHYSFFISQHVEKSGGGQGTQTTFGPGSKPSPEQYQQRIAQRELALASVTEQHMASQELQHLFLTTHAQQPG